MPQAKTQRQLAPMLKLLEDATFRFGIKNTEINQTTLEQVFMQVASQNLHGIPNEDLMVNKNDQNDQITNEEYKAISRLRR